MQTVKFITLFLVWFLFGGPFQVSGNPGKLEEWLIPKPRELTLKEGCLEFGPGRIICHEINDPDVFLIVKSVQAVFTDLGHAYSFSAIEAKGEEPFIRLEVDTTAGIRSQGYRLTIGRNSVSITASDKPGLFYGVQTLRQIAGYAASTGKWPVLEISDWPDFERRGVMLDVNKDQVPTMETFRKLIDLLASWKINEFQIFFKYAFAFVNHPEVSQDYSPVTAEQIIELDHYCKERFIDLVPYHDGFGKLSGWMKYKRYLPLAECPEGCDTEWGKYGPSSLSPAVPASLELVDEIYSELLPNYSSKYVNIGSDETMELGKGRSRELCEKYGVGRVYLNFLKEVKALASKNGRRVQFWGDIILKHPDLIPEIPKEMIPLVWGYEANQPLDGECARFRDSGLDFYVCPGTSAWNSIIGRWDVASANLLRSAEEGKKYGAMGFLNTNWGEYGNWHPLSVCYPGYLYGAAVCWAVEENKNADIPFLLDQWVFHDNARITGEVVTDLGKAHLLTGIKLNNNNIFNYALTSVAKPLTVDRFPDKLTKENISRADSALAVNVEKLNKAAMTCTDARQVQQELVNAVLLCRHACRIMRDKISSKEGTLNQITEEERQFLIDDLSKIIAVHRELWIQRNSVGGLQESTAKLQHILDYYRNLKIAHSP